MDAKVRTLTILTSKLSQPGDSLQPYREAAEELDNVGLLNSREDFVEWLRVRAGISAPIARDVLLSAAQRYEEAFITDREGGG